jgi:hypothetical protein
MSPAIGQVAEPEAANVTAVLKRINEAWLEGTPDAIGDYVADNVVMVFPGFQGSFVGREAFVGGFRSFCDSARIKEHRESDFNVDLVGSTAVASFRFDMIYERGGSKYRSAGRDLWVFEDRAGRWVAVWRTMMDLVEEKQV